MVTIDATGLHCPLPLLRLKQGIRQAQQQTIDGSELTIRLLTSDPISVQDIERFCHVNAYSLVHQALGDNHFEFVITVSPEG